MFIEKYCPPIQCDRDFYFDCNLKNILLSKKRIPKKICSTRQTYYFCIMTLCFQFACWLGVKEKNVIWNNSTSLNDPRKIIHFKEIFYCFGMFEIKLS